MEIRNIAIIAHVDHGKTTLTDALLRQTGAFKEGVSMDSNALELERGITIYSKNAAINYKNTKINIVDTPGHADFGSEVERVLRAIDSVLLVVDAQEGPMPQTRFVLKKSLELGIKPIVIINKIDKPAADPVKCVDEVLELFLELGASDEQANFPVVYANGKAGIAKIKLTDESNDLTPLLETIIKHVPSASSENLVEKPLRFQPFNLGYDNFLGRLAVGRVYEGVLKSGENIVIKNSGTRTGKISKIFTFNGLERVETSEAIAGDIALVAGLPDIYIGETVMKDESLEALPAIKIDEPTISLNFLVNNSPFGGREGKFVTSRQIREYLERELEVNVGLRVEFASGDIFSAEGGSASCGKVSGRGELHIAILLENMRRAGYELQVSQPQVIIKEEGGEKLEPFEEVIIDAPAEYQGTIIERLGLRGFILTNLFNKENIVRLSLEGPTRGILGYRNQFTIDTKGEGIFASHVLGFKPMKGEIRKRATGSMVSMANGKALGFSLWGLQDRGMLYIGPGTEVYKGMVIGNTAKGDEMFVNPTKGKELTNMRSKSSDEALTLSPPYILTIERGLEIMSEDEYLEITPQSVRLRKQNLVK
ncbi:GTP-binding protein TypA [Candidatus Giovannonibacteria bacterium RIFCSPLOWO2_01_FULL_43_160]|uniref:50S ribosomal subunit assembly factor BipA n=2 Tax=Candidatus Giovannoniibacteriota TaxID=1752738 RepID=A0A0G1LT41_9BACT|nr:MAG: GTP-binding protein TypA/BipA [Candidatus Giovannonibacteria bacterium GW2011_GWB1_43_13]KKS99387.1 MAG: GTP-binding protein TypA/BipA [Candidatus Giovannonibacteria bacterium GW2011_GWA1_43_15]KKT21765.1 MAG: GTP-binding protein TypA/BipA [Candidatus Giovannonibacteria bacterium GW2011_GWC2_43_8]KKT62924.1 MAG: GTP-binding protein TypA/BipA [Candidatus Giovannonibacteria bacterium GW2011_GWA2_44_26]OGF58732.1 MAG: GTP-binding protein TypA [Candidatus Giovannonibacteria bacterium RIFCSP